MDLGYQYVRIIFFHLPVPKPPDIPIERIMLAYKLPMAEDNLADVDVIESDLNMDFEENGTHQEDIICKVHDRQ